MTDYEALQLLTLVRQYVNHYAEDADKMTVADLIADLSVSTNQAGVQLGECH